MSRRSSIVQSLVDIINTNFVSDSTIYSTDISNNAYAKLKFWDEVRDFPCIYVTPGSESREYLPAEFKWGYLALSIKVYTKGEEPHVQLESILEDLEKLVDNNETLVYDSTNNYQTTEILIASITTDEGLLAPYGVAEMNLQVRYAIM